MGPMLAVFLALSLNLAPADVGTFTIDSYVLEGVGLHSDANTFLLERRADGQWQLHDAHGNPWFLVGAAGHVLSLTDPATGTRDDIDLRFALGLPDEEWWLTDTLAPSGADPLLFSHLSDGVDVRLDGQLAGSIRW